MKVFRITRRALVLASLTTPLFLMSSCGSGSGGGGGSDATADFGGLWTGTWVSANPAPEADAQPGFGGLSLQLDQNGKTLIGTCRFDGHHCLADCEVACQVKGETVTGSFQSGPVPVEIRGQCSEPQNGQPHHGNGSHHANGLTGTFEIRSGPCAGQRGTIDLRPTSTGASDAVENERICIGELILIGEGELLRVPVIQHR